jgi:class 3 adenylate cyclase
MRLRRKITAAFFLVSTLVSLLLAVLLYRFIDRQLEAGLKTRLRDIAQIGAQTIDRPAFAHLVNQLGTKSDDADDYADWVATVEQSPDYARVSSELNGIKQSEKGVITYVYTLTPTSDPHPGRYVVDADVLQLEHDGADDDKISHYDSGSEDVANVPTLARAVATCQPVYEDEFTYDEEFHVDSVSAYYPILDDKGACLGILGVDISAADMESSLRDARNLALYVSIGVVALALLVSIIMGTVLTRSLLELSATVRRFADKDFAARTAVATRDEIGQLAKNFNQMATTIQEHSDNLESMVRERTSELYAEKQTSERLLLNVLPAAIAQRLKDGEGVIVDRFEAVSVLFADIVGFTTMSSQMPPEEVVQMLDDLFSLFDRLAEEHHLEKIKTIGDAYMVVAGIPDPRDDHARAIARMAIDMQRSLGEYAKEHGRELSIRIGVHTGSVVAGVIGKKKFIYDLWGDTVNTASRMESHGVPGRIHVTAATHAILKDEFEFESRGTIDIKGKGPMETYLLVRETSRSSPAVPTA